MYVIDKVMMLYFYKKPKHHDEKPLLFLVQALKFAILLHLIVGSYMYSNNSIFQTNPTQSSKFSSHTVFFLLSHILIYIALNSGTPILVKMGYLNPSTPEADKPIQPNNYFNEIFLEYL